MKNTNITTKKSNHELISKLKYNTTPIKQIIKLDIKNHFLK